MIPFAHVIRTTFARLVTTDLSRGGPPGSSRATLARPLALVAIVTAVGASLAVPLPGRSNAADEGGVASAATEAGARPEVLLRTSLGDIVLALEPARAPRSVENFLQYVDDGFYDNTLFHRVIEGFMIQGGGFDVDLMKKQTRPPIANEADNGLSNARYSIAMARTSDPNSATAQFFINHVDNGRLDHTARTARGWGYTVFGEVIDGFATVDAIAEVATGAAGPFPSDVPREPVVILSASRVEAKAEAGASAGTTSDASPEAATTDDAASTVAQ